MARRVTFECTCPQSIGEARINDKNGGEVRVITWLQSGEKWVFLEDGDYKVHIRATGTQGTTFELRLRSGGTMNIFRDELVAIPDDNGYGTAAMRKLEVKETT